MYIQTGLPEIKWSVTRQGCWSLNAFQQTAWPFTVFYYFPYYTTWLITRCCHTGDARFSTNILVRSGQHTVFKLIFIKGKTRLFLSSGKKQKLENKSYISYVKHRISKIQNKINLPIRPCKWMTLCNTENESQCPVWVFWAPIRRLQWTQLYMAVFYRTAINKLGIQTKLFI